MNARTKLLSLSVAFGLCASASAGDVLRVGASRAYSSIAAAIAAAKSGDLILVDPGSYRGFALRSKAVAVLAAGAPYTLLPDRTQPVIDIEKVPQGQTVTVGGFVTSAAYGGAPPLRIRECPGVVRIRRGRIDPTVDLPRATMRALILATKCRAVFLEDVTVVAAQPRSAWTTQSLARNGVANGGVCGVLAIDSQLHFLRTRIVGYDNRHGPAAERWGGDAIRSMGRTVLRFDGVPSWFRGGGSTGAGGSAVHHVDPRVPHDVLACSVSVNPFQGGAAPKPGGALALNHDRGWLPYGARGVRGCIFGSVGNCRMAAVAPIGQALRIGVASPEARAFALYVGPPGYHVVRGYETTAYLDYGSSMTFLLRVGQLPSGVGVNVDLPVPLAPSLVGFTFGAQAVLGPPSGGVPLLSATPPAIGVVVR